MEGKRAGEKDDAGARERRKKGAFWRNINPIYESLVRNSHEGIGRNPAHRLHPYKTLR